MNLKLLVSITTTNIKQSPTPSMANTNPLTQGLFASCLPIFLYVTYATFNKRTNAKAGKSTVWRDKASIQTRLRYHIDVGIIR